MPRLVVERHYGAAKKAIAAGLAAFNRAHMGEAHPKCFAATLREGERIVGGIVADVMGEWMFISLLWVDEEFRKLGFGRRLLETAEDEGRRRGGCNILVDTFSFQAPDFYRRAGFVAYGEVPDFPQPGASWIRLMKRA